MALTDEERAELKKLTTDELIDLLDGTRDAAKKQAETEKREIMRKFLAGSPAAARDDNEDEETPIEEHSAFQRLKRRFS